MERLTEEEFLFIWEPLLGTDAAWAEYCNCTLWSDLSEFDFSEEE